MDCLDKTVAPATGIPADDGLSLEHIRELLGLASKHPSISLDVVEVNPHKIGAEETIHAAQEVIRMVIQ